MSKFATALAPDPVVEPETPEVPEPELDPDFGEEIGDEIILASVRKQKVARTHGQRAAIPGVISARAWQATGRVD